jgi:RimJ/RimL family protein N-acetyltransferase
MWYAGEKLETRSISMTIDAMFTQFPCLTTDRLLLRQIQLTDAEALFAIFFDNLSKIQI